MPTPGPEHRPAPGPIQLFATAAPGLEQALLREVQALAGVREARAVPGGVEFGGDPALVYRANLHLRGAGRVLLRLVRFGATHFQQVVDTAAALPWERYLRDAQVECAVTCHKSKLYHSDAVAERLRAGIAARLRRARGSAGAPGSAGPRSAGPGSAGPGSAESTGPGPSGAQGDLPMVFLRGVRDQWELSLDTSGPLLHLRGYRQDAVAAPLRESLAAALLLHAGYDGGALCDLCCGSGTFLIEAALLRRRAANLGRDFAFQRWPAFSAAQYQAERDAAQQPQPLPESAPPPESPPAPRLCGVDRDPRAIAAVRSNAERAGVLPLLSLQVADMLQVDPAALGLSAPGLVVANPPYGKRLAAGADLLRTLQRHLVRGFSGWRVLLLLPAGARTGAPPPGLQRLVVRNGGLPIAVLTGLLR